MWPECAKYTIGSDASSSFTINASVGCSQFDHEHLTPFAKRATHAIRQANRSAITFYEPEVFYDMGAESNIEPINAPNVVFNFHNYNKVNLLAPFLNLAHQIEVNHSVTMMSEFGTDTLNVSEIKKIMNLFDQYHVSRIYWAYINNPGYRFWIPAKYENTPVFGNMPSNPRRQVLVHDMHQPPTGNNIKKNKLRLLSRPYPQFVSGKIQSIRYHAKNRSLVISFIPLLHQITQVYMPKQFDLSSTNVKAIFAKKNVSISGRHIFVRVDSVPVGKIVKLVIKPKS